MYIYQAINVQRISLNNVVIMPNSLCEIIEYFPHLCEVKMIVRPSLTMSEMTFHKNRLAFGSIPVVGSS